MADNMPVTPGIGKSVAADDVGGILFQRIKLTFGIDGVATDVSSQAPLPVSQATSAADVKVSSTRPANTTAYAAKDVVGAAAAAIAFANVGPSAGAVMITGAELEIDVAAVPAGMAGFRMHLYNVTPPSALADNAAFDLAAGDRAAYLGFIDLGTPEALGSTLYVSASNLNKQVKLAGTGLWGYLVTSAAFTPGSADVIKATLHTQAV